MSSLSLVASERGFETPDTPCWCCATKYVGGERQEKGFEISDSGLNQKDKTLCVRGACIAYILGGDETSQNHIPSACKDSVAMLFIFDLTSRCTFIAIPVFLSFVYCIPDSVPIVGWYQESRKWNQTAIPILIGTKFDDLVQLLIDVQWTIASQARAYARALNATLFFSSATYNINVNKIFKFITAKQFNQPCAPQQNLTIGEPIIDF
ncbi:Septum-promoting GTP-binding protein 1 [Camellia lanceoleosa]|uniref:Septum-promoting GTP-binding protein 1 n=1 Tax=Camellia lanceoleosa TaxID=1840588 RepID=A0ACC0HGW9_9ERIC|nr:Septum-promoting GTP-binding protein 1 [Camellia lanceoleosa]